MKKIFFAIAALILLITAFAFYITSNFKQNKIKDSNKIKVVATLFPLYDFAKNIGKEKIEVSLLLPPGVDAHSFEPKPSDIIKINEADVFIYTGKFMEPWVEDILNGISEKEIKVVDSSFGIEIMKYDEDEKLEHKQEQKHYNHNRNKSDPHIWLDFENAQKITELIAKALSEKDLKNADYYMENANIYKSKLKKLDNEYKKTLSKCKSNKIIYSGHYAFGYMTKRYGLQYTAARGFSPDSEPSVKDLIEFIDQIRSHNIKYIFYEELSSDSAKIAETLRRETKIAILPLSGAHNISKKDYYNNINFIYIMRNNLKNLKIGLQCE